ncbi:Rv0361 family membrane protein [Plantactinospora endophytica]|uniref:DUF4878 domain-containing protein n=1 Tax=Plantactinospora endophytica TaxID=673535 RepID=A0ABQ4E6Z2_9ACTN|nr:hypothetical protein [Plantactinospora endophytica]GIG90092.1 hypothetical protein Pen02_50280 [Plantactinospora endophytica]
MVVVRRRVVGVVAVLAMLPLGLTGCGLLDGFGSEPDVTTTPVDDGPDRARERVQAYLDAMKAKSVTDGREQLCEPLRESFDQAATGPNGDFAKHFSVSAATITDVRANGADQDVSTSITIKASGKATPTKVLFTVARADGQWCIAKEAIGGHEPAPSGSPTPAT